MTGTRLESTRDTYVQDVDSCGNPNELVNLLRLKTTDAGGGSYLVIKTKRWALNDDAEIDEFAALLKATLARVPEVGA